MAKKKHVKRDEITDMYKVNRNIRSALVYTFASVLSRGIAIITTPIFTRIMTTEQIGIVNLYNSWNSLISVFATLSLTSGGFSAAMNEFKDRRSAYISSVLFLTSAVGFFFLAAFVLLGEFFSQITGLSKNLLCLMAVGFILNPARDFWLARQRYEYKYRLAGSITVVTSILSAMLSVVWVYAIYRGDVNDKMVMAEARIKGSSYIMYLSSFIIWIYIFVKGKTAYNHDFWKLSLSISLPLIGYSVTSQILNVSDRMMISHLVNDSAVGIYSTLYSISSLSLLVWSALNSSFVPYLYQNIGNKNEKIKNVSFQLLLLYSIVSIALVYFAPEIVKLLATSEYYQAVFIMPPIAAGIYYTSVSNMYSNVLIYLKKSKYIMYSSAVAAATNIVLNYVFIKQVGYYAAAYTTLFSYILMTIMLAYYTCKCAKESKIKIGDFYSNRGILTLSLATTTLCLLGILFYSNNICRYVVAAVLLLVVILMAYNKRFKMEKGD